MDGDERLKQAPGRTASLAWRMAASVALFVLVGSLALLGAFERQFAGQERVEFERLAQTNARFVERSRLPRSARMAAQLGEILGLRVFFQENPATPAVGRAGSRLDPAALRMPRDGRAGELPNGDWVAVVPGRGDSAMIFVRPAALRVHALRRRETWWVLGGFWILSLGLGGWLARRVTRPLSGLAESLPWVGSERELPPLPVHRSDEIGRLAQTLERTHRSLREERERRRAAERHAMLGRMAASLAHELRNPLAAIHLHSQLLEHASPADAAVSRRLIESEAERISDLLGQWLGHARPAPPLLAEVELAELVRQTIDLLKPQADHARVSIEGPDRTDGVAPRILADGQRVRQVLGNLLRNALQASPAGACVRVALHDLGTAVEVRVEDQGRGFSPSALARFGEAFYSEKEGGMGLGLAVAREICEAHGGSLTADNLPGGGAVVCASFPKQPPDSIPHSRTTDDDRPAYSDH